MRKRNGLIILTGGLLVLLVGSFLGWATVNATSKNLTQPQAEQLAIKYAHEWGLVGEPTLVQSKLVSRDELKARLNIDSSQSYFSDPQSWLVVFKGKVLVNMLPSQNNPAQQEYDNAYVELSVGGVLMASGSRSPGHEIDLSSPVPPIPDK